MSEAEKFATVPWAPGMEERQLEGVAWRYLANKMVEARAALRLADTDPSIFRWQVILDLYVRGPGCNAQAALMLGLGLLDQLAAPVIQPMDRKVS